VSEQRSAVGANLEPLIFERSRPGRAGGKIPSAPSGALDRIPPALRRARRYLLTFSSVMLRLIPVFVNSSLPHEPWICFGCVNCRLHQ